MVELKPPSKQIRGEIHLPASKSIANRLLIIKYLKGEVIPAINDGEAHDIRLLKKALVELGNGNKEIDVHHAGTAMRFLAALLSVQKGTFILKGSERMHQRPIGPLVDALKQIGADISYADKEGFPPLKVVGKDLDGGHCELESGVSSQFITALMLIGAFLKKGLAIHLKGSPVSTSYLEMTSGLLKQCGADVSVDGMNIIIKPGIGSTSIEIESDWSAASYLFSICALSDNSEILMKGLQKESLQGDSVLPVIFNGLGVKSVFNKDGLILRHQQLKVDSFSYDCTTCPDLAQTLACTCYGLGIECHLTGLKTLRIKETDRIAALHHELSKLGAKVISDDHSLRIEKRTGPITAVSSVSTYNDHRMAMSFAPLCLVAGRLLVEDQNVVEKSWPAFWRDLISLGFNVNLQPS